MCEFSCIHAKNKKKNKCTIKDIDILWVIFSKQPSLCTGELNCTPKASVLRDIFFLLFFLNGHLKSGASPRISIKWTPTSIVN